MADTVKIEDEVVGFLRNRLSERLVFLTGAQRQKLASILGVRDMRPASLGRTSLERAIDLIDRQVRKNNASAV